MRSHSKRTQATAQPFDRRNGRTLQRQVRIQKHLTLRVTQWAFEMFPVYLSYYDENHEIPTRWLASIAYPAGWLGSLYPNTSKKPGIACRDPIAAESSPYCMFAMATIAHIAKHFRFAQRDVSAIFTMAVMILLTLTKRRKINVDL